MPNQLFSFPATEAFQPFAFTPAMNRRVWMAAEGSSFGRAAISRAKGGKEKHPRHKPTVINFRIYRGPPRRICTPPGGPASPKAAGDQSIGGVRMLGIV